MSRAPDRELDLSSLAADDLDGWDSLAESTGAGYFASPGWAISWYECFAEDGPCRVGVWYDDAGIAAIAPMVRTAEQLLSGSSRFRVGIPTWRNLGSGLGGADHVGFACRSDLRDDALVWALSRSGTVRLESFAEDWAESFHRRSVSISSCTRTHEVDISAGERPGSKKLWKHIARSRRHLVSDGVELDHLVGSSIDPADLRALFELHGRRSRRAGRRTTFTPAREAFHRSLVERSTALHMPFLVRARLGDELVGALYGFAGPRRLHYYQSGWEPAFERLSLGSVLIGDALDLAIDRRARTFDFLRGDEPYKARFGARPVQDISAFVPRGIGGAGLRLRVVGADLAARRRSEA